MGGPRQRSGQRRGPLREVYVARTTQEPQPQFENFLNRFGRRLGLAATIHTIASTHLTFLESSGVADHFRNRGYSVKDIQQFRGDLEQHLRETLPDDHATVTVDEEKPLRWMGRRGKVALNIVEDETLANEREQIELFLEDCFGELPSLRAFEPHITIGQLVRRPTYREWSEPMCIVPRGIEVPESVALNGLEAYLGRFQPDTRVMPTAS